MKPNESRENSLTRPIRILLIEDDGDDAFLFREWLSEANHTGFQLTHVERLGCGLEMLKKGRAFDLILLDLSLPESPEGDVVAPVINVAGGIPIIVLTGLENDALGLDLVKMGVQDYLVKQKADGKTLIRAIRYAIERQRMIQQLARARELEHYLASHDVLTGLPNRKLFYDRLKQSLTRARRHGHLVGILFLDLDGFKRINDTLGHSAGDKLLKEAARRLKEMLRESDTISRLGGDEFTIVLDNIHREQDVRHIAEKILKILSEPYAIGEHQLFVTGSIGVSMYPFDGTDVETLVKHADIAMYRAKSHGKNTCQFYNVTMDSQGMAQLELERDLRQAVDQQQFVLHYQPLFSLKKGKVSALEALVRWQHPKLGMIPPNKFIPVVEETGLIDRLGEWIIQTACKENRQLQVDGYYPLRVAVNLSAHQFRERNLHDKVFAALQTSGLDPEFLCLEITETNIMRDIEYTIDTLRAFKEQGIRIAIDDFGTGYSSLSYLKKLPADSLKIDRSFIDGVPSDQNDTSITSAIIGLAHNMSMGVVAEGVETAEQLSYLRTMSCDEMQGFHFSRPMAMENLRTILP